MRRTPDGSTLRAGRSLVRRLDQQRKTWSLTQVSGAPRGPARITRSGAMRGGGAHAPTRAAARVTTGSAAAVAGEAGAAGGISREGEGETADARSPTSRLSQQALRISGRGSRVVSAAVGASGAQQQVSTDRCIIEHQR